VKDIIDDVEFIRQCICKSPFPLKCVICKAGNAGVGLDFCLLGKILRRLREVKQQVDNCDCWDVHKNLDLDRHTCGCACHGYVRDLDAFKRVQTAEDDEIDKVKGEVKR
jgi:hypothetical protein